MTVILTLAVYNMQAMRNYKSPPLNSLDDDDDERGPEDNLPRFGYRDEFKIITDRDDDRDGIWHRYNKIIIKSVAIISVLIVIIIPIYIIVDFIFSSPTATNTTDDATKETAPVLIQNLPARDQFIAEADFYVRPNQNKINNFVQNIAMGSNTPVDASIIEEVKQNYVAAAPNSQHSKSFTSKSAASGLSNLGNDAYDNIVVTADNACEIYRNGGTGSYQSPTLNQACSNIKSSKPGEIDEEAIKRLRTLYTAYIDEQYKRPAGTPADTRGEIRARALEAAGLLDPAQAVRDLSSGDSSDHRLDEFFARLFYGLTPPVDTFTRTPATYYTKLQDRLEIYLPPLPAETAPKPAATDKNTVINERNALRQLLAGQDKAQDTVGTDKAQLAKQIASYLLLRRADRTALSDNDPRTADARFAKVWRTGDDLYIMRSLNTLYKEKKLLLFPDSESALLLRYE